MINPKEDLNDIVVEWFEEKGSFRIDPSRKDGELGYNLQLGGINILIEDLHDYIKQNFTKL